MFELDQSDEMTAIRGLASGLASDLLGPLARTADQQCSVPDSVADALFATGLLTPVAESSGGGGVPRVTAHMGAVEALAYGDAGLTMAQLWRQGAALVLGACVGEGAPEGVADALRRCATEQSYVAPVAFYEGYGRSPDEWTTTITSDDQADDGGAVGSGAVGRRFRVRGTKLAVRWAAEADLLIVVGRAPVAGGLVAAAIVNPATTAGVTIRPDDKAIALGASPSATVTFDVEVAADQVVSGADAAPALDVGVSWLRLAVAASACGVAQRAIDYASKYATERVAFGKPIASFQGVSFMLADAAIRIGTARLEMLDIAARIDHAASAHAAASDLHDAVSRAVNYSCRVAVQATRDAVQVLGGHGFITDHPVELWYRSAAALSVLDFDPMLSNFEAAI